MDFTQRSLVLPLGAGTGFGKESAKAESYVLMDRKDKADRDWWRTNDSLGSSAVSPNWEGQSCKRGGGRWSCRGNAEIGTRCGTNKENWGSVLCG